MFKKLKSLFSRKKKVDSVQSHASHISESVKKPASRPISRSTTSYQPSSMHQNDSLSTLQQLLIVEALLDSTNQPTVSAPEPAVYSVPAPEPSPTVYNEPTPIKDTSSWDSGYSSSSWDSGSSSSDSGSSYSSFGD